MNADQTYNSIAFKWAGSDLTPNPKSLRRASARGTNVPDVMTVANQAYVDSRNKIPGKRVSVGIDYYEADANGVVVKNTAIVSFLVPSTSTSTALTSQLATLRALVAAAGILEAVINGEI